MLELTFNSIAPYLTATVEYGLQQQQMNTDLPNYGAFLASESGLDEAGHGGSTRYLANCMLLILLRQKASKQVQDTPSDEFLIGRILLTLDYMLGAQRETGLIDLRNVNYDSSPDTGFAVQILCAVYDLANEQELLQEVCQKIEQFVRKAVPGILSGGFHTPNHRWVIVGALSYAQAMFPDMSNESVIRQYIAEGYDVDAEGTYLERSVGVYDAVTNRSLLLFADHWGIEADTRIAHKAIEANLDFNRYMLHADGTAETGLSRRQDYGTRKVPGTLVSPYLHAAKRLNNDEFVQAAHAIWQRTDPMQIEDLCWLVYTLLKFGEPKKLEAALPNNFSHMYPINQVWRTRQDDLSATVYGGATKLMNLVYGNIELSSIKISQTYSSAGRFIGDAIQASDKLVTLTSEGQHLPRRPGYDLPVGYPVSREDFESVKLKRGLKPQPPAKSQLQIETIDNGFRLHYKTLSGLDQVAAQIALDFPSNYWWETEDSALYTQPGQVIFLKNGWGRMQYGQDVIEISTGAYAHHYVNMRESEPPLPHQVRVLMTFVTPVDFEFTLTVKRAAVHSILRTR